MDNASPTLLKCTVQFCGTNFGGITTQAGGIELINATEVKVNGCKILSNAGGVFTGGVGGGGILINGGDPTISNCTITGNVSGGIGGGIMIMNSGTTIIKNCLIADNQAKFSGGGIGTHNGGTTTTPKIINCIVASNTAGNPAVGTGGGIELNNTVEALVQNCLITGNEAFDYGGGIFVRNGDVAVLKQAQIINSTIAYNQANHQGGGVATDSSTRIYNSILFGNQAVEVGDQADAFTPDGAPDNLLTINYSDIQGGQNGINLTDFDGPSGFLDYGPNNIDADPQFVDFDGADNNVLTWADNNFRVMGTSPIIDAASNLQVPADDFDLDDDGDITELTPWDLDKSGRFNDVIAAVNSGEAIPGIEERMVDMGAFEVSAQFPDIFFTKDRYVSFMPSMTPGMPSNETMIIRLTRLAADPADNLVRYVDCTPHPIPDTGEEGNAYYLTDTQTPQTSCLWTDLVFHVTGC